MTRAECRECGFEWILTKDVEEYEEGGPRCADPDCRARNVDLKPEISRKTRVAAVAFRRFREEDDTAVDLVVDGVADPDRAEELSEKFARLTHYDLVAFEDIEAEKERAREKGRQEVARAARERIEEMEKQLEREYEIGYDDGRRAALEEMEAQEA